MYANGEGFRVSVKSDLLEALTQARDVLVGTVTPPPPEPIRESRQLLTLIEELLERIADLEDLEEGRPQL